MEPGSESPRKHYRETSPELDAQKRGRTENTGEEINSQPEGETLPRGLEEDGAENSTSTPPLSNQPEALPAEDDAADIPLPTTPDPRHRQLHLPNARTAAENSPDIPSNAPLRFSQIYYPPGLFLAAHPMFGGRPDAVLQNSNPDTEDQPADSSSSSERSDSSMAPMGLVQYLPGELGAHDIFIEHRRDLQLEVVDRETYTNDALRKAAIMRSAELHSVYNIREGLHLQRRSQPVSQWENTHARDRLAAWRNTLFVPRPSPLNNVMFPEDVNLGGGWREERPRSVADSWRRASGSQIPVPQRRAVHDEEEAGLLALPPWRQVSRLGLGMRSRGSWDGGFVEDEENEEDEEDEEDEDDDDDEDALPARRRGSV
ncbi:hypothetical protein K490DRAFT_60482 [Saccharata proteae CBS 121410]|uniref:Uncharacterized protein n=1 Tax=Saccharata proteae CBS 121410 TaxID=1314787 RepID=A0A9P4HQC5_9PEZI|nr:hypothetical protein K490DRAFT_60482 [Saccharata proteae CBS 121410]